MRAAILKYLIRIKKASKPEIANATSIALGWIGQELSKGLADGTYQMCDGSNYKIHPNYKPDSKETVA